MRLSIRWFGLFMRRWHRRHSGMLSSSVFEFETPSSNSSMTMHTGESWMCSGSNLGTLSEFVEVWSSQVLDSTRNEAHSSLAVSSLRKLPTDAERFSIMQWVKHLLPCTLGLLIVPSSLSPEFHTDSHGSPRSVVAQYVIHCSSIALLTSILKRGSRRALTFRMWVSSSETSRSVIAWRDGLNWGPQVNSLASYPKLEPRSTQTKLALQSEWMWAGQRFWSDLLGVSASHNCVCLIDMYNANLDQCVHLALAHEL